MAGYAWLGFPLLQFGSVMIISSIILSALYSQLVLRNIVIQTLTATTSIMLLLTILESIGLRPLASWIHSGTISYPAATVGHRQHLAGWYAIMSLAPVFIYRNRRLDPWFWVWLLSAFAGVSLCTTSSATLGVVIGLLGWFFVNIRRFKLPLLAIMAFIFMTLTLPLAANTLSSVLNTTSSNFKDYRSTSTIKTRLYMWSAAFSAALQRPFFGWGDETFAFQVFEHLKEKDAASLFLAELSLPSTYKVVHKGFTYYTFDPKGNDKQTGSLIYLRAHGIIFDEMYSRGIIGFIVFCSMILSLILYVHKRDPKSLPLFIASASPYMIYLLAWFYVPTVTPFYLIIIGLMISSIDSPLEEKTQTVVR
ncbi:O-antigen ligase family protein [Deinococcus apachensis]|uniref:O-antigen ligase family protein n=1 Tax=Deinococcus apachensis TaxID=309886 RepID=UPI00146AC39A|nr:O-antigen ligase family protein [Deinococcus apachensis]